MLAKYVDDDHAHIKILFSCARQICQKNQYCSSQPLVEESASQHVVLEAHATTFYTLNTGHTPEYIFNVSSHIFPIDSAPHGRSSLYYTTMAGHGLVMKLLENLGAVDLVESTMLEILSKVHN